MSYKLTTMYGIPHGHAVALCLPRVWEYMRRCGSVTVLADIAAALGTEDAVKLLDEMLAEMALEKPIAQNREAELAILVNGVNLERLGNHPVPLSADVLRELYEQIVR